MLIYAPQNPREAIPYRSKANMARPADSALNEPNGRIAYRFHARDLHLVMGPGKDGKPVRFRVRIDGKAPTTIMAKILAPSGP
jgi:hypothetical protein